MLINMQKIKFVCDSAADITKEAAEKFNISIVPVVIVYECKEHLEHYEIDPVEYWDLLESTKVIPNTCQVPITSFLEQFERALNEGYTHLILSVLNSKGSGSYNTANTAKEMFYEEHGRTMEICVLDSGIYAVAHGNVVLEAAKKYEQGVCFEEIVLFMEELFSRTESIFLVLSLKQMKKSGRISGGAAFVGEALGLKPIIHAYNGEITVIDKVRGEKQCVNKSIDYIDKLIDKDFPQSMWIIHGKVSNELYDYFKEAVSKFGVELKISKIGPSVATNTGPNLLALTFYGKDKRFNVNNS